MDASSSRHDDEAVRLEARIEPKDSKLHNSTNKAPPIQPIRFASEAAADLSNSCSDFSVSESGFLTDEKLPSKPVRFVSEVLPEEDDV